MSEQTIFKRYEIKYMLNKAQYMKLKELLKIYTIADVHGKSTICSLYFDTPDYLLIRRSLEGPLYKEKLRLRSYGVANSESQVFIELKKKYEGVVYKRRVEMRESEASQFLLERKREKDSQILREIDYCLDRYEELAPACLLTYSRRAYYGKDNPDFRITFDDNILWRDYDLNLHSGIYGEAILEPDSILMEIKVSDHIPLWLVHFLSENHIYKTSFSKYGSAYKTMKAKKLTELTMEGMKRYA